MEFKAILARDLDPETIIQLGVLVGRAYTDERHVREYSEAERLERAADIQRIHAAMPGAGEMMPEDYLKNFPTWRNGRRPAENRREALHLVARGAGYIAAHVSLWAQYFSFAGQELVGGYIEDVATDPLHLGQGLAMAGMREAARHARTLGLDLLGLATGLNGYYERLGWTPWTGDHIFHVAERNAAYPDQPLYLLPLSEAAERIATGAGTVKSWRLARFGDPPSG